MPTRPALSATSRPMAEMASTILVATRLAYLLTRRDGIDILMLRPRASVAPESATRTSSILQ